jgi:methyltransferase (TIGR00027 family)
MSRKTLPKVDSTAIRVALWRAMHVLADPPPHILDDVLGLKLVAPDESWRERPDMHPRATRPFRASIVARARFIEDLVEEVASQGVRQYVILGAGLDTFAQRRPEIASRLRVFEIDKPGTQAWKRQRLGELGFQTPDWLTFVPFDFESGGSWWDALKTSGFDAEKSALVTSIGVSMYLTREAIVDTLRQMARLAPGSKFIMTYLLPLERVDVEDQPGYQMALKGARASGTPFLSFFTPDEMGALAREAGFHDVEHLSTASLASRYFAGRADSLRPSSGEELLIATTR